MSPYPSHAAGLHLPPPRRGHYLAVAAALGLFVVYGSFLPWQFEALGLSEGLSLFIAQLTSGSAKASRTDFSTNVLLFVPLTFAAMGAFLVDRPTGWRTLVVFLAVGLTSTLLSLAVELGQIWIRSRTPSRLDVLAQMIGTLIGSVGWIALGNRLTTWLRSWSEKHAPSSRVGLLLWIYLAGLCVYNILPLDLTLHPVEIAREFTRGRIVLVPFSGTEWNAQAVWAIVFDAIIFIPVGVLCSGRFTAGKVRSVFDSVLLGALIVLGIECAQIFVLSRFSDTADVIAGTAGVFVGAWLGCRWGTDVDPPVRARPIRSLRYLGLALVCSCFACAYLWWPLEVVDDSKLIRQQLTGFWHLPFARLHGKSDFLALTEMLRKFLLFAPIGGCLMLAVRSAAPSRGMQWALVAAALSAVTLLAVLIELVQAALVGHLPDMTDSVLYTLGAASGMAGVAWLFWRTPSSKRT